MPITHFMERYLKQPLRELIGKKILLLMGPRQVGKTSLAKDLCSSVAYHNYDVKKDVRVFQRQEWDGSKRLVVFDELHKMRKWKLWLKGLYDEGRFEKQSALVTGSARLDISRKMGDSLAGRCFSFRLHPLDLKELKPYGSPDENYRKLITIGNFPEPFLEGTTKFAGLWRNTHSNLILKQDLIYYQNVRDLEGIEVLVELLSERVGSTVSFNSLAEDLDRDDKTIKSWIGVLENLYIIFRVSPLTGNMARGLKKAGKYYFYDIGKVQGGEAQKLENLVALSLKKEIEYDEDVEGVPGKLGFLRTKDGQEIDFIVSQSKRPKRLIEVKLSEQGPSPSFKIFARHFDSGVQKIQLVRNLYREFTDRDGVNVRSAVDYLCATNYGPLEAGGV